MTNVLKTNIMKKLSILFSVVLLLASCSKGYKVTVTFPDDSNNGETVFLTNYDTGDTIATATVENNTCTIVCPTACSVARSKCSMSSFTVCHVGPKLLCGQSG